MAFEYIGFMFRVMTHDVAQPRGLTSETNMHTYACWQMVLWECNIEQLICIVHKTNIRFGAIFESGLACS